MQFAIKKKSSIFWTTNLSLQDIREKLSKGRIAEDWLVSPEGEANRAVPVSELLARPGLFDPAPILPSKEAPTLSDEPRISTNDGHARVANISSGDELSSALIALTAEVKQVREECIKIKWAVRGAAFLIAIIVFFGFRITVR